MTLKSVICNWKKAKHQAWGRISILNPSGVYEYASVCCILKYLQVIVSQTYSSKETEAKRSGRPIGVPWHSGDNKGN